MNSLNFKKLSVYSKTGSGKTKIINSLDFNIEDKSFTAFVGESGSGKTILAHAISHAQNNNLIVQYESAGYQGHNLDSNISSSEWKQVVNPIVAYLMRDTGNILNPTYKLYKHIIDVIGYDEYFDKRESIKKEILKLKLKKAKLVSAAKEKRIKVNSEKIHDINNEIFKLKKNEFMKIYISDMLTKYGFEKSLDKLELYPHQLSSYFKQKILLWLAFMSSAKIIVLDDPTFNMENVDEIQYIKVLKEWKKIFSTTVILFTANIQLATYLCDFIYLIYGGHILEKGPTNKILKKPSHPYTWALISTITDVEAVKEEEYELIGSPYNYDNPPLYDPFADRNNHAVNMDFRQSAPFFEISEHHYASTWILHPKHKGVPIPKEIKRKIAILKEIRKRESE